MTVILTGNFARNCTSQLAKQTRPCCAPFNSHRIQKATSVLDTANLSFPFAGNFHARAKVAIKRFVILRKKSFYELKKFYELNSKLKSKVTHLELHIYLNNIYNFVF